MQYCAEKSNKLYSNSTLLTDKINGGFPLFFPQDLSVMQPVLEQENESSSRSDLNLSHAYNNLVHLRVPQVANREWCS